MKIKSVRFNNKKKALRSERRISRTPSLTSRQSRSPHRTTWLPGCTWIKNWAGKDLVTNSVQERTELCMSSKFWNTTKIPAI